MGTKLDDHIFVVNDTWESYNDATKKLYDELGISATHLIFQPGPPYLVLLKIKDWFSGNYLVILHAAIYKTWISLLALQIDLKRMVWVMWGMDLRDISVSSSSSDNDRHWINKTIIPSLGAVCPLVSNDFSVLEKAIGPCPNYFEAYYSFREIKELPSVPRLRKGPVKVLLGNSANPSNNHIEAIEWIADFKHEQIKIFCPLSYGGSKAYVEKVVRAGKLLLGDKFHPIVDMMPIEKYFEFLDGIDVLIFNHHRQQGLGNLIHMLLQGKPIYIRKDSSTFVSMKEMGIELRDSCQIPKMSFSEFSRLIPLEVIKMNLKSYREHRSGETSIANWKNLFNRFRQEVNNTSEKRRVIIEDFGYAGQKY